MKEESLLLLSDLQKLINQVVLIDYTIIILGELDLRELLLIAAGTLLGSCLGVTMMCLFQINKDCRVKRKEDTDYEKEKHSEDCPL